MGELKSKIDEWLCALENAQREAATLGFPAGSIPSVRTYPLFQTRRQDPNVFFPALIGSKLREWKYLMTTAQAERADELINGITKTFPRYKSRRGRKHYNFWPTDTDIPFPNGKWLHRFDFFRLPDDIDDTAMVFEAMESDRQMVFQLQQNIEQHLATFYPDKPTLYGSWLGDKMPWVVDACAMINLMALFDKHNLESTIYSTSSNLYLDKIISKGSYINSPYAVAPYYPDSAIIAYHLAKWLSQAGIDNQLMVKFSEDVKALLAREVHPFKKMLYAICLLKLGETQSIVPASLDTDYPWFYGTMLSAVKPYWLNKIGRYKLFHIAHTCQVWNRTVELEYSVLKKMKEK